MIRLDLGVVTMRELSMYRNPALEEKIDKFLLKKVPDFYSRSVEEKKVLYENLVRACKNCALRYDTGYNSIPNRLNPDCFAVFIGRNPCKAEAMVNDLLSEETKQGLLFKKYLSILGLGEGEISILNMACCHGKGNRPPTQSEINRCIGFRKIELDIIGNSYKVIFAMGNDALRWIFGLNAPGVLQSIGDWYEVEIDSRKILVIPVVHPSHLLIDPSLKKDTVAILKKSREMIEELRKEFSI